MKEKVLVKTYLTEYYWDEYPFEGVDMSGELPTYFIERNLIS